MNPSKKAAWVVVTPAIRRHFDVHHIPVPVRLPVWLHSEERKGLRLVRMPAALAAGLNYGTPFFNVAESSIRPAHNLILHSRAAHAVRRSSLRY